MAYVNTRSTAARLGLADRIASLVKMAQDSRRRNAVYRQTVYELNQLTERELNDLGIHRSMIATVAREAANGK